MEIINFTDEHIDQVINIAKHNYENERKFVPALPPVKTWPDISDFVKNGLGVVSIDGDKVLGYLCCVTPFKNAFHSTDAVGVFSPMHCNGSISENREVIYARMYQSAAEKWVKTKASSHAICLYAHDTVAQNLFFHNGFGIRCMDAIRPMEEITLYGCPGYTFEELHYTDYNLVYPLYSLLGEHMAESPCFIVRSHSMETFSKSITNDSRFFVAKRCNEIVAFLKIVNSGETFITDGNDLRYVDGAFCLPEHRGRQIYPNLLNYAIGKLKVEGYKYLGVDFESINPTAYHFWPKYFNVYTHSVVRRIDEHSIKQKIVII